MFSTERYGVMIRMKLVARQDNGDVRRHWRNQVLNTLAVQEKKADLHTACFFTAVGGCCFESDMSNNIFQSVTVQNVPANLIPLPIVASKVLQ